MALRFGVISADDHVQETPDLWTERLSKRKWGDRVPHIAQQPDGTERWVVGGKVREASALAWTGALSVNRFEEPQRWADVPLESYDPSARLKAMDRDQVDVQVLYPSGAGLSGEALAAIEEPELEVACVRAYNDWLLETWGAASDRFVPQCILPVRSAGAAVKELGRALALGHRGVVMPPIPWHANRESPHINDQAWDPLWDAIQEADGPVCWHSGSDPAIMLEVYEGFDQATARAFDSVRRPISNAVVLANFLMGGIPERYPRLKVIFASAAIVWVPFQLELSDHEWDRSHMRRDGMEIKPGEIFRRQCYVTTWADKAALDWQRGFIGVDKILWQSEFPMENSPYPNSAETIKENFSGMPQADRDKILRDNASGLYKISV